MRYGLPYMGSKNAIVPYLIKSIPSADNFYDLFAGGCAVTHGMLLQNKFKNYIINDLNAGITQLFLDAINGKYKNEKRWISREDFRRLKDEEPYVAYVWSFGNNPDKKYLYGAHIEPWKKALWYSRKLNDPSLFQEMGIITDGSRSDIKKHKEEYKQKYIKWYLKKHNPTDKQLQSLQSLESLERLERLQSLQSLESLESLERFNVSYEQVPIKPNSVLYCDIPYENTAKYVVGDFDHKKFYDWACNQTELVIISSYEISDDRFMEIDYIKKRSLLGSASQEESSSKNEKLFIPKHQKELYEKMMNRKIIEQEHYEQLSLL